MSPPAAVVLSTQYMQGGRLNGAVLPGAGELQYLQAAATVTWLEHA